MFSAFLGAKNIFFKKCSKTGLVSKKIENIFITFGVRPQSDKNHFFLSLPLKWPTSGLPCLCHAALYCWFPAICILIYLSSVSNCATWTWWTKFNPIQQPKLTLFLWSNAQKVTQGQLSNTKVVQQFLVETYPVSSNIIEKNTFTWLTRSSDILRRALGSWQASAKDHSFPSVPQIFG